MQVCLRALTRNGLDKESKSIVQTVRLLDPYGVSISPHSSCGSLRSVSDLGENGLTNGDEHLPGQTQPQPSVEMSNSRGMCRRSGRRTATRLGTRRQQGKHLSWESWSSLQLLLRLSGLAKG